MRLTAKNNISIINNTTWMDVMMIHTIYMP